MVCQPCLHHYTMHPRTNRSIIGVVRCHQCIQLNKSLEKHILRCFHYIAYSSLAKWVIKTNFPLWTLALSLGFLHVHQYIFSQNGLVFRNGRSFFFACLWGGINTSCRLFTDPKFKSLFPQRLALNTFLDLFH